LVPFIRLTSFFTSWVQSMSQCKQNTATHTQRRLSCCCNRMCTYCTANYSSIIAKKGEYFFAHNFNTVRQEYRLNFIFMGLCYHESNWIIVQQMRLYSVYYISVDSCACFGYWHPSSGDCTTVITPSGTGQLGLLPSILVVEF